MDVDQPVAWMVYTEDGNGVYVTDNPADITANQRALPLYTAPTTRTPLTDEQISSLAAQYGDGYGWCITFNREGQFSVMAFARAIEAAHGIGEKS